MLKETVTYEDFNGEKRTEEFHFHLTKAEVTELEVSEKEGLANTIETIIAEKDFGNLVRIFKKLILISYGKKSPDGRRFIKTDELRREFSQTAAFSEIFMKLATDSDAAKTFVNGIMPKDLAKTLDN